MNTKKYTFKRQNRLVNQSGNTHLMMLVGLLVAVALVAIGVYVWQSQDTKDSNKTSTTKSSQEVKKPAANTPAITLLSGKLTISVPEGWTKGTETNITKDFNGTKFLISFQPQAVDYLKLATYGGFAEQDSGFNNTHGKSLFTLRFGKTEATTNLVVSSCAPSNGYGCSPDFDGKKLYVVLAPLGDGGAVLAPLDYNLPATADAIFDFEKIAKVLPL